MLGAECDRKGTVVFNTDEKITVGAGGRLDARCLWFDLQELVPGSVKLPVDLATYPSEEEADFPQELDDLLTQDSAAMGWSLTDTGTALRADL